MSSFDIIETKYDDRENIIYLKYIDGFERWFEYNENNNIIYYKNSRDYEYRHEYDENNNLIYSKNSSGVEKYYKYDECNRKTEITEQEFENIKIREYNLRTKCSRFELMEI